MSNIAAVVIGACFGDEGKGLVTDYLSTKDSLVVRFNGGGQAGHTVVTPEGLRHVFHQFGAGTLRGAATYLSQHFMVDPHDWNRECVELKHNGFDPEVYVNRFAPLTTPYDILVNDESQITLRHGSCGFGIWETACRSKTPYATCVHDISTPRVLRARLERIRDDYAPVRFAELTGQQPSQDFMERIASREMLDAFIADCERFYSQVRTVSGINPGIYDRIIFEGAQGLLLDQDHRFAPYVTGSKTGLSNVLRLCRNMGISRLFVHYVTRSYMTRHGAGPFPSERQDMYYRDYTNYWNSHQGHLRFGALDPTLIGEAILADLTQNTSGIQLRAGLAVTHLDLHRNFGSQSLLEREAGLETVLESFGPTRADVVQVQCDQERSRMEA